MLWPVHSSCPNRDLIRLALSATSSARGRMVRRVYGSGAGWHRPTTTSLKSACNLGYAKSCSRLPADRHADAVRFALGEERDGILHVRFACERAYLPVAHGELLYEKATGRGPSSTMTRACSAWLSVTCRRSWRGGSELQSLTPVQALTPESARDRRPIKRL